MSERNDSTYGLRRLRISPALRDMLADTSMTRDDLMYPVFVRHGQGLRRPIESMPGVHQYSADTLADELARLERAGLRAAMLFGVVDAGDKDETGSHALRHDSVVAQALKRLKDRGSKLLLAVDLCFCEYTSHGHCGVPDKRTGVANASTLENLGKQAIALAQAGADLIAPSGMMDGAVGAIRGALDSAGFGHVPIMGYTVKYASAFYGPFRDAAESAPKQGDRRQYQQDPRRDVRDALAEAECDLAEGADILMVKPGLPYLDVLAALRARFNAPLAAYQVSGEYAMLRAAAERGWTDYRATQMESLLALKRAGASIILTYAAPDVLEWL